jgi:putative hydrolase of the HAD superfamily
VTATLPRPLRAVLFDLDDTLYAEHAFVDGGFRAVAALLAPRLQADADALAKRLWALHARDGRGRLFDALLAEHGVTDDPDLVLACLLAYRTHEPFLPTFDGVVEALDAMTAAGLALGVVSDGAASVQWRKLRAVAGLAPHLGAVVMTDELGPGLAKPSPVPFRVACRLLDVAPAQALYVGNDPRKDFAGAREAGLGTVRMGRVPDEGAGRAIDTGGPGDADLVIDDFPTLTAAVTAAARAIEVTP